MLLASYLAGASVLAILPSVFFVARCLAKRSKRLPWATDDTLLVLSLFFLYLVVAAFFVAMVAGHVRHHIHAATVANLRITLMVLWLFRIPMAFSLALTRCAIAIFFIRTLYTRAYPWLRHIGIRRQDPGLFCTFLLTLMFFYLAYGCLVLSGTLGLVTVLAILLHCRPIKYNFMLPFENNRYCFSLEPLVVTMAAAGVALDAVIWLLPHCVVWRLQLRRAHKLAITGIFAFGVLNIVIGGLRISALTGVAYGSDVTFGIGTTLLWALAQISAGIIVACCPHLRPVFEMIVPRRLTRISTRKSAAFQHPRPSIMVTTRIDVRNTPPLAALTATFHDGHQEPWAPTFNVEQGLALDLHHTLCSHGHLRRGSCCL
ncbi:hypothetical protein BKA63DRAFT_297721 [Paraphoma chrysanthemicola]|nr:hypothetical protein BKA63DRAFT_297721 [Paraphoma chrysanthemicola]